MRWQTAWIWLGSLASLAAPSLANATAQRTFVSAAGIDNPSCSIAAPCRSFSAAISATNAGGQIIVLDSAGYGPLTITKSLSIIAPPRIYGGIGVLSGNGVTIDAPGAIVVLRGLSINGQGGNNGILAHQAARVRVENCVVSGMAAVGIYHTAPNAEMIVTDTTVRDNNDGLALVAAEAAMLVDRVRSEHNQQSGFYAATAMWMRVAAVDSVFAYNGAAGIWAQGPGQGALYRNTIIGNGSFGVIFMVSFEATIVDGNFANYPSNDVMVDTNATAILNRKSGHIPGCFSGGGVIATFQNNALQVVPGCKSLRTFQ